MNLSDLTSKDLILLDVTFEDRMTAIYTLSEKLAAAGKLTDTNRFIAAVMKREEEGPTALGEYLAVPHGKSDAVKEPVFACARVKGEMPWKGIDGDEPVSLIFLLAIPPAHAGSTHMEILTQLTCSLAEDKFREQLMKVQTPDQVLMLFGSDETEGNSVNSLENDIEEVTTLLDAVPVATVSRWSYSIVILFGATIIITLFMLQ